MKYLPFYTLILRGMNYIVYKFFGGSESQKLANALATSTYIALAVMLALILAFIFSPLKMDYNQFMLSFSASFAEDIIFFIVIGFLAILVSRSDPSKEEIERRLTFLFSGSRVSPQARAAIQSEIRRLGSYSDKCRVEFYFSDYSEKLDAVKTTVFIRRHIINMFKSEPFETEIPYSISVDNVGKPGKRRKLQGQILSVRYFNHENKDFSKVTLPIDVYENVAKTCKVNIEPDQFINFEYKFWVWFKRGNTYTYRHARYTEKFEFHFYNETGRPLVLERFFGEQDQIIEPRDAPLIFEVDDRLKMDEPIFSLRVDKV